MNIPEHVFCSAEVGISFEPIFNNYILHPVANGSAQKQQHLQSRQGF